MPSIRRTALVPFTTKQMYQLVNDIEQYPEFLPWCPETTVHGRSEGEIQATVHFSKAGIAKSFTTKNTLVPNEKVEMQLMQGPFKHLTGSWSFIPIDKDKTQIHFNINFEFKNTLMALALGPIFQHISATMVNSFTKRAFQLYKSD